MRLWIPILTLFALAASPSPARDKIAHASAPQEPAPTFTRDIAPIVFKSCAGCHRPGNIGPFALLTYADVKRRVQQIADVTRTGYMPPWHADSHGEFANERKLTQGEIDAFRSWSDGGAVEGDPKELPALPAFPEGWQLGEPDLLLQPARPHTVAAEGPDEYHYYVLHTSFSSDRWISGIEFRPGNTRVTHHIIGFVDTAGTARRRDAEAGGNGYDEAGDGFGFIPTSMLGGWAPGNMPEQLPDGVGLLLPKGADIVLQVHYHKDGKPEVDRPGLGLHFAQEPIDKRLRVIPLFAPIDIPAGAADYATRAFPIPAFNDMTVIEVMPHMHLLGKEMTIRARLPDGTVEQLIRVPRWDFNWQTTYRYRNFVKLPAGTLLGMNARYDNSAPNPRNPNSPPRDVRFGEATTDEMCLGFIWFTYDKEHLTQGKPVTDLIDTLLAAGRSFGEAVNKVRKGLNFDFD
jgi:hypothetical protein